ncbi:MAG: 5'/3'-nucleotidase SurE [Leptolyngbyaceae cyanobacterium SL_1_1]|nr:5'/3'-nucleotidase SurE [Leptolyngbyaceae cyanobacterium RM1_1_2]NJO09580.1 5'/3'-nucleotidase SurE [Leptolyngbyaceae cyanobacterium SL_1_1]
MTIVLTNDDGIDAPGIAALQVALGDRPTVWVAPDQPLSGCSHQINRGGTIAIEKRSRDRYAIGGTPADCTRVALSHLCPQAEFVISGINAGGNLGSDTYVSGTVAAVREATLLRVPGIAISHYIQRGRTIDWTVAVQLTVKILDKLWQQPLPAGAFWNVNLPHLKADAPKPDVIFCPTCTQPLPTEYVVENNQFRYVGDYGKRRRDPGADVDVCFSGNISVTQIRLW